jgi:hypothetical protein
MAERDLVQDSVAFSVLARVDIAQFYPSIYTHTIGWSLHGREKSLADKKWKLLGSRIDRLIQYANDQRTNGIPIGSAMSDVIAELILADIDRKVSVALSDLEFVAVRFKDDYRFLCKSNSDAEKIIRELAKTLAKNNLSLNESKTSVTSLPDGLFRAHDRAYFPASLRETNPISFKRFQHTLLTALDIHRKYPGTSLLEKFLSELIDNEKVLKLKFSSNQNRRRKEIHQVIALLFLLKRESEKVLSQVLAVIELLFHQYRKEQEDLKEHIRKSVTEELVWASERSSVFEVVWLIFFSRLLSLGIKDFSKIVTNSKVKENAFYKSIVLSRQEFFNTSGVNLFSKPKETREESLAQRLDIFRRD